LKLLLGLVAVVIIVTCAVLFVPGVGGFVEAQVFSWVARLAG